MKIKNFILNNYKYILFFLIIIFINEYLFLGINVVHGHVKIIINIIILIIEIMGFFLINYLNKKEVKLEKQFLIIFSFIGLLFLLVIPIGNAPDEQNHYLRAYEISEGHFISKENETSHDGGQFLPDNIGKINVKDYQELKDNFNIKASNKNEYIAFTNTALYFPTSYLPQAIGIKIGTIFNTSLIIKAYLGRIVNFITFIVIMYFAIKYMPFKKNLLFFISFLPVVIQSSISLSPDALTIASVCALISFTLYMKYTKKGLMSTKEKILFCILPFIIATCKIVYLPVCLFLFLIPKERFKHNKYIVTGIIVLLVFIVNLLWTKRVSIFLLANIHNSNSILQSNYILTHPLKYLSTILRTLDIYGDFYIFSMLGKHLVNSNVVLYTPYLYISSIIFIGLLFTREKDFKKLNKLELLLSIFIFLIICILIITSIYIQWSSYKLYYVEGVQGRYFIPIIILLGLIIPSIINVSIKNKILNKYVILFIYLENISAIIMLLFNFI